MKRIIALVLSLVMALSLCAPAWGAGKTNIIIADKLYDGFPVASVVESPEHVGVKIEWNVYESLVAPEDAQLEAAFTFSCTEETNPVSPEYEQWYCDFYVKLDRDLGEGEIFLGGNYGGYHWVGFDNGAMTLEANEEIPLLGTFLGGSSSWTYDDVATLVGTFLCGVSDVNDALAGATFTVMLRVTNPNDATEFYDVATVEYTFEGAVAEVNGTGYPTLQAAVDAAKNGDTIVVKSDITESVTVGKTIVIDTNGLENVSITIEPADDYEVSESNGVYFVKRVCNVAFDANGGSGTLTIAPMVESEFILPANPFAAPAGKQFKGWATSKDATEVLGETYKVTGDVTFYAIWEDATYTVTFDANGGENEYTVAPMPAGKYTLPANPFTAPEGMKFKGWATTKDATEVLGETYTVTGAVTLYAIWEADIVEVPKTDEDTVVEIEAVITGDKVTITEVENLTTESFEDANTDSVTLDLSKVETSVSTVVIPTEVVSDVKEVVASTAVDSLKIVTAEATVTFDAAAVETISDNVANNASVSLTVDVQPVSTATDVSSENQEAFAEVMEKDGSENAMLLSIELVDENDTELFSEGKAAGAASVKVKLANGLKSATLYYLKGDEAVKMGSYNADADGYITVTLEHFSEYVLLGSTNTVYTGGYYPIVGGTTTTPDADETVTSPKTFDAGVALYVGMSVAAAVGTVTLGKKRED